MKNDEVQSRIRNEETRTGIEPGNNTMKKAYLLWEEDLVKKDDSHYWKLAELEWNIDSENIIKNLFWQKIKIYSFEVGSIKL